jgi:hypothetical protein
MMASQTQKDITANGVIFPHTFLEDNSHTSSHICISPCGKDSMSMLSLLPHKLSWRRAYLVKHRDNLPLLLPGPPVGSFNMNSIWLIELKFQALLNNSLCQKVIFAKWKKVKIGYSNWRHKEGNGQIWQNLLRKLLSQIRFLANDDD